MKTSPFSIASILAIGILLTAGAARGQDAKPDADGYIRHWLMLAPIPLDDQNGGAEFIGKEQIAKESELKPKAGDPHSVPGKQLSWKKVQAKDAHFDFNELLGTANEFVAGYMVTYIVTDRERTGLTLLIGSNDQGRVYLNGKEVFKTAEARALEKDSDKVEKITLNKGVNVIVFKVINDTNNWQGSLRFMDSTGKPVTDLTVKLAP